MPSKFPFKPVPHHWWSQTRMRFSSNLLFGCILPLCSMKSHHDSVPLTYGTVWMVGFLVSADFGQRHITSVRAMQYADDNANPSQIADGIQRLDDHKQSFEMQVNTGKTKALSKHRPVKPYQTLTSLSMASPWKKLITSHTWGAFFRRPPHVKKTWKNGSTQLIPLMVVSVVAYSVTKR